MSVSGLSWAVILGASLTLSALLVPRALGLTRWVEWELVLVAWWLCGTATLAYLLYRGWRIRDDHDFQGGVLFHRGKGDSGWWLSDAMSGGWAWDDMLRGLLVFAALLLAAVAVDFLLAFVFFVVYYVLQSALASVANDDHACQGDGLRAIAWGAIWSATYTLPLAGVVWLIHVLAHRPEIVGF